MTSSAVDAPRGLVRWQRTAADPRSAACALGCGSVVALGFLDGGYYESTWRWTAVALATVAGMQIVLGRARPPGSLAIVSIASLAALAALAAWMLLSGLWGIEGTEARREAERCTTYVAALAALLAVARPAATRALLIGVVLGTSALAAFALTERLAGSPGLDPYQGSLLKEPVGYANALGIITAVGAVVAVGLALETRSPRARAGLLTASALCASTLALTSSRGAVLAGLVGVGVLVAARVRSAKVAASLAVAGAALLIVTLSQVSLGDRPAYWRVAAEDVSEHYLLGSGAGSFDDMWLEQRSSPPFVRDAHNLYLETLAELGPVGLLLLVCALGAPLLAAAHARRDGLVAAGAAGYSALLVHAGLDWDWEMPVTVVAGLACAAAVLSRS
jgi:O-antigen ligase